MRILRALLLSLFASVGPALAGDLNSAAQAAAGKVAENPQGLEALFDKSLFRHISMEKLGEVFAGIYRDNGAVEKTVLVSSSAASGHFYFDTEKGWRVPVALSVDPATGLINGIFFGQAYKKDVSLRGVRDGLAALPGRKALLVRRLGEKPEDLEALDQDAELAVGSAFKLYVLGALVRAGVPWDKVYKLREEDKSLPTGRLRGWPDGSPLTAHTLAAMMISESDNTASDVLIGALGRRRIEQALPALGHSAPSLMEPFLKTSEMFKLKSGTGAALKYLNLPAGEKYAFLDGLAGTPPDLEKFTRSPFGIDKIEWFASPADLCRVMAYLEKEGGARALEILGMNPGLPMPEGAFLYAGYKGGSEPGVLSMTWLLKDRRSEWLCLSASWNDDKENLDDKKFFGLMRSALGALGAER